MGVETKLSDSDVVDIGGNKLSIGAIKSLKEVVNSMLVQRKNEDRVFIKELHDKGIIRSYLRSWWELFPSPHKRIIYIPESQAEGILEAYDKKEYKLVKDSSSSKK